MLSLESTATPVGLLMLPNMPGFRKGWAESGVSEPPLLSKTRTLPDLVKAIKTWPCESTVTAPTLVLTVAEAEPPVPPSSDETFPVVLTKLPEAVATTFTEKVHDEFAARVAVARDRKSTRLNSSHVRISY